MLPVSQAATVGSLLVAEDSTAVAVDIRRLPQRPKVTSSWEVVVVLLGTVPVRDAVLVVVIAVVREGRTA